jgi:hypothetical protein
VPCVSNFGDSEARLAIGEVGTDPFAQGLSVSGTSREGICPPVPVISVQNARQGFFERADFESVRAHLPETYQGVATFAFLSGWRVAS